MQSRKFILGAAGTGSLATIAIIATLLGHATVAAVAQVALLAGIAILAFVGVLSQRQTGREVSRLLRQGVQVEASYGSAPTVTEADLIGTLRLLQAQYVARLDRAQATLERAAADLATSSSRADVVLPGAGSDYVAVVEAALAAGLKVAVLANGPDTPAWVREKGWADRVVVIAGTDPEQSCA